MISRFNLSNNNKKKPKIDSESDDEMDEEEFQECKYLF